MSDTASMDPDRRLWMTATSAAGGVGLIASAVPFVASLAPSERVRALGAPVEVELQTIQPGEIRTVEWRGKPVFVPRRTPAMLDALVQHDELLADPLSRRSIQPLALRNAARSSRPGLVVLEAICTHLGCIPSFRPVPRSPDIGASWPGAATVVADPALVTSAQIEAVITRLGFPAKARPAEHEGRASS